MRERKGGNELKYVCSVCGYVYDEAKETVLFNNLPADWKCPVCKAGKSAFKAEQETVSERAFVYDEDMLKLSYGQTAALFSNLARGCEKQYLFREQELFLKLAEYYDSLIPEPHYKEINYLARLIRYDLDYGYPDITAVAAARNDRGALRVKVWGEKVTNNLSDLLDRFEREGTAFLEGTNIWVCSVCGFVYVGDEAPSRCPVCKVPDWKFDKMEGGRS